MATPAPPLSLKQLNLAKERSYYDLVLIISIVAWVILAATCIGILYGGLIALGLWFAHGLVMAKLRSESVLVTEEQMPELYQNYLRVVDRLEIGPVPPPLYIVQAGGVLNAFATRRGDRDFVVIYSDMLEACGAGTPQMRFILGHELGHVRSRHVRKKMYLLPGLLAPLLGSAYSRACEASCDRHGAYAADDPAAAAQAMLILAGGRSAWQGMDAAAFSRQYKQERGFFASWHELTSGYPTLPQRASNLLNLDYTKDPVSEPRHPLAYVFALFFAGGRSGSGANLLVMIFIVAMLSGIAVPALTAVRQRAAMIRSGGLGAASIKTVTFSSALDQDHLPVDRLSTIPNGTTVVFVSVQWDLVPGQHTVRIQLADGMGKTVTHIQPFFATSARDRTWTRLDLSSFQTRPVSTNVVISLDNLQIATRSLQLD